MVSGAGVTCVGGVGLLLAVAGRYSFAAAIGIGVVVALVVSVLAWPPRAQENRIRKGSTPAAFGMCVVAVAFSIWNGALVGHHVLIDIDSGANSVAAKWISIHGNLEVPAGAEWADKGQDLILGSAAMFDAPGGKLQFQFVHLLPTLMAEAEPLGGDTAMFAVVSLLGALGLCAVYAAGCRLVRNPWLVLAAVTALGFSLPQIWVSRDPYSEPGTQFLLWTGIWLIIVAYERRHSGVALLAGLALGGTMMTRVDALLYLAAIPLLAALACLAATSPDRRGPLLRTLVGFLIGTAGSVTLGLVDLITRSNGYYAVLQRQVTSLERLLGASALLAVLVIVLGRLRFATARDVLRANRERLSVVAGVVVAAVLVAGWSLRPAFLPDLSAVVLNPTIPPAQRGEGLPVQPAATYAEQSIRWMSWYLGPITVTLAILGLSLMVARAIRHRDAALTVVLSLAGSCTVFYLWNPQITPTQIYVMRRYVPAVLPLLVLAAVYGAQAGVEMIADLAPRFRRLTRFTKFSVAVVLLVFPIGMLWPVRSFQVQAGYNGALNDLCSTLGHRAAVLIAPDASDNVLPQEEDSLPQAVRSWCDIPVAQANTLLSTRQVHDIAIIFAGQGRTLWVIASTSAGVNKLLPGVSAERVVSVVNDRQLEWTLSRPPAAYIHQQFVIYASPVAR